MTTQAQTTIKAEFKRRMDLVNCPDFRKFAADAAKKLGVTAQEWNQNKAAILLMLANEACGIENKGL